MSDTPQNSLPGHKMAHEDYLNATYGIRSWLLTTDHKRIALLYLGSVTFIYIVGGIFVLYSFSTGGLDTGWTFYTPLSSVYSNSAVTPAVIGIFINGFSSILTGLNFIVTIHTMRAPGMTWFRLPLFVWAHYATSLVMILGTPV